MKGHQHSARLYHDGRIVFHPLVAVEICKAHRLEKELGMLETLFAENGWGHYHLFDDSHVHLLATVAEVLDDDERQGREKRKQEADKKETSMKHLREECRRLSDAVEGVKHARDQVENIMAEREAAHARAMEETDERHAKALREMEAEHAKAMADKCCELETMERRWRGKCKELADAREALRGFHDMNTAIAHLDWRVHMVRMQNVPRDMPFRVVLLGMLRDRYPDHPVYGMPAYYVRAFEWEVCDLVMTHLNLSYHPEPDGKGDLPDDLKQKMIEALHRVMSRMW
eukprot:jgi/Mesvir1/16594/Mv10129-RA.1